MRWTLLLSASLLTAWSALPRPAAAVELALVLLNDVSKSMDASEYEMVKEGYRAAFSDPEIVAALLHNGGGIWNYGDSILNSTELSILSP